jgi:hypothetical protein
VGLQTEIESQRRRGSGCFARRSIETKHGHGESAGSGGQAAHLKSSRVVGDCGDLVVTASGDDSGPGNRLAAGGDRSILRFSEGQCCEN